MKIIYIVLNIEIRGKFSGSFFLVSRLAKYAINLKVEYGFSGAASFSRAEALGWLTGCRAIIQCNGWAGGYHSLWYEFRVESFNYVPLDASYFQFKLFLIKIIALEQSSRESLKIGQQNTTSNAFTIVFGHFHL